VSKVERLENEVRTLSTEELAIFREWFREFDADAWDREIEADVRVGKLDDLADRALHAHRAGKSTSL
jgi:uncharacterized protein (UPF0335 family)